jgi:hypothetical protein
MVSGIQKRLPQRLNLRVLIMALTQSGDTICKDFICQHASIYRTLATAYSTSFELIIKKTMPITLYDLKKTKKQDDRDAWSPNTWKTRFLLNVKVWHYGLLYAFGIDLYHERSNLLLGLGLYHDFLTFP